MLATAAPVWPDNGYGGDEVVVALVDTGISPTHQEFDYAGPASTTDQIVAWWDFTTMRAPLHHPTAGQVWDTHVPDPYDDDGHGTATASLAVGRNAAGPAQKEPSFAPGAKLAVARVCSILGCSGDIPSAIRWAANVVGADVISVSQLQEGSAKLPARASQG